MRERNEERTGTKGQETLLEELQMKTMLAAVAAFALAAPALAASPFDGTWKVDPAASQMSTKPNILLVKGGTYSCPTCVPAIKVPADGKPHAVKGNPYYDMLAVTVVDASTVKRVSSKAGKPMGDSTLTVSPDGKTLTSGYNDLSAPNGVPVTGVIKSERVAAAAGGAHAISGSWKNVTASDVSESGTVFTMKLDGDTLTFSTPTGISYTAKVGGPQAPVTGDPGWTAVTLVREGANTLLETDYRGTKKIGTYRMTVAADGATMTGESDNFLSGRKSVDVARKQ